MKYDSEQLLDRLAAEYVLGTLGGPARRRLERLCSTNAVARAALHRWEDEWSLLSSSLEPVQPSPRVWANVSRRVSAGAAAAARPPRRRGWQLAAAAGLAALALIAGLIVWQQLRPPPLRTLAILATDPAHPLWQLERRAPLTTLTIRTVGAVQRQPDKAFELWALPRGAQPVSLGLLPAAGTYERTLSAAQRAALLAADKVAVSVEPTGGSPTGNPTGPIIIVQSLAAPG